jgi:hypothetical protein
MDALAIEERVLTAKQAADQVFWAKVAELFPEATTGDFPPDAHLMWVTAVESSIRTWVRINVPVTY